MPPPYRLLRCAQGEANPFATELLNEHLKVEESKPKEQEREIPRVGESKLN